jgi:tetratricopeptide (TPR) repeat protein
MSSQSSGFNAKLAEVTRLFSIGSPEAADELLRTMRAAASDIHEIERIGRQAAGFGRLDLARECYNAALALDADDLESLKGLARLDRTPRPDLIDRLVRLEPDIAVDEDRAAVDMLLGQLFEDMRAYDRSFEYYQRGNAITHALRNYDETRNDQMLARYTRNITGEVLNRLGTGGRTGLAPIFIVGMPRSGSTLCEQILASHPEVLGGGELTLLPRVISMAAEEIGSKFVDDILRRGSPSAFSAMADIYIDTVRRALGERTRVTDKLLENFWNVGLIRLMFPDAKVIHCQRDPLDNCFTIFRRPFTRFGPPFANDLGAIGRQYRRQVQMMQHWDAVLPGFVYPLRYEALIDDFEAETRRLVAWCGLTWDDRCLEYYRTERGVRTASVTQVRRPPNRDSIGIAAPYRDHLGPLIEALLGSS